MPKKTLILIITLFFLTSLLLYLATREGKFIEKQKPVVQIPVKKQVNKDSVIFFSPSVLNMDNKNSATSSSVDVFINSGINKVTGVQLEMSFDPKIIYNIIIKAPDDANFFGKTENYIVLFKDVDMKNGRLSYALAITPSQTAKSGTGKVATLTFKLNKATPVSKTAQTNIDLLNKTLVTGDNAYESLLKQVTPLTINLGVNLPVLP